VVDAITGTTEECLDHYGQTIEDLYPKGSSTTTKGRDRVAEFCGVHPGTVYKWFLGENTTKVSLAYLRSLFLLAGYKVMNTENIPETLLVFRDLVIFKVLTREEAVSALGYSKSTEGNLFSVLSGTRPPSQNKLALMRQINSANKESLEKKKEKWRGTLRRVHKIRRARSSVKTEVSSNDLDVSPIAGDSDDVIEATFCSMSSLLFLLEGAGGIDEIKTKDLDQNQRSLVLKLFKLFNGLGTSIVSELGEERRSHG